MHEEFTCFIEGTFTSWHVHLKKTKKEDPLSPCTKMISPIAS